MSRSLNFWRGWFETAPEKDKAEKVEEAHSILRAHAAQVRKDNPVTDECPRCGSGAVGVDTKTGKWIIKEWMPAAFCPTCGLPLQEDAP